MQNDSWTWQCEVKVDERKMSKVVFSKNKRSGGSEGIYHSTVDKLAVPDRIVSNSNVLQMFRIIHVSQSFYETIKLRQAILPETVPCSKEPFALAPNALTSPRQSLSWSWLSFSPYLVLQYQRRRWNVKILRKGFVPLSIWKGEEKPRTTTQILMKGSAPLSNCKEEKHLWTMTILMKGFMDSSSSDFSWRKGELEIRTLSSSSFGQFIASYFS